MPAPKCQQYSLNQAKMPQAIEYTTAQHRIGNIVRLLLHGFHTVTQADGGASHVEHGQIVPAVANGEDLFFRRVKLAQEPLLAGGKAASN